MPYLICTFASKRSRPEKIQRWIAHLDELQKTQACSPDSLQTIAILRSQALSWIDTSNG